MTLISRPSPTAPRPNLWHCRHFCITIDSYLHQNCIARVQNLAALQELDTITLSNNLIKTIPVGSDFSALRKLKTLQIANNFFRTADDLAGLSDRPEYFLMLQAVLNLMGNPLIKQTSNYRRSTVARLQKLTYLDDRPVFDTERRAVNAAEGGLEAERVERQRIRDEEHEEQNRNFEGGASRAAFDYRFWFREEARRRRIAADPAAYAEVEYLEPLCRFRDDMLRRIDNDAADESGADDSIPPPPPLEGGMESGEVEVQPISCAGGPAAEEADGIGGLSPREAAQPTGEGLVKEHIEEHANVLTSERTGARAGNQLPAAVSAGAQVEARAPVRAPTSIFGNITVK
ncbi:MAG: hypothetical protein BJ554DRAFT_8141 [Olpidium bornovanus]|uniref:Uncharacterized protein n=1 Tax=Olpidium bornovanus TaxID=278681 RepID=A0A8H7ZUX7_9FUNG|nr:MAG: hypothetical protein BJ554DRAFT_8141 [Olpidium bornovanus]